MTGVHRAARAFGDAAAAYDRARPDYPPEAVDWLVRALELGPGRTVVDLAAGTGKLTRPLARTRARVIAVEPAAGMLERLRAAVPEAEALAGTAEAIPLGDDSADALTVAQAFHWFANEEALAEVQRVLRPGGRLALVWNRRDLSAPAHAELERIFAPYQGDVPRHRHGTWRAAMEATERFAPLVEAEFAFERRHDVDGFVERAASTSFIAALPDDERERLLAEVAAVGRRLGEPIVLPYVSELFAYVRR
jgi:ubiquinone/menaquinone biosynthesis C-methylase UbiE